MAQSARSTSRRLAALRSRQYLNAILTVNAILVASLVWTRISDGPSSAHAGPTMPTAFVQSEDGAPTGGVPNAAGQRERLIAEVRGLRDDIHGLESTLNGGKIKVNIGNLAELKKLFDDAAAKANAPAPKVESTPSAVTPSAAGAKPAGT